MRQGDLEGYDNDIGPNSMQTEERDLNQSHAMTGDD